MFSVNKTNQTIKPISYEKIDDFARGYLGSSDHDKFPLWFGEEIKNNQIKIEHHFIILGDTKIVLNHSVFRKNGEYFLIRTRMELLGKKFLGKDFSVKDLRRIL